MAKSYCAGLLRGEIASCRYRLKEFVVNWFRRDVFDSPTGERLALAIVVLLSLALYIALSKLAWWLRTRKRGEGEREYWRIHE